MNDQASNENPTTNQNENPTTNQNENPTTNQNENPTTNQNDALNNQQEICSKYAELGEIIKQNFISTIHPQKVLTIRLPVALHKEISRRAHSELMSMNKYCILRLYEALK